MSTTWFHVGEIKICHDISLRVTFTRQLIWYNSHMIYGKKCLLKGVLLYVIRTYCK